VNFAFSAEQEELRSVVRQFLEEKAPESAVREQMESGAGFDPALWEQMAGQLGLPGLAIPEEYGGMGFGFVELAVVLEEMGRSLVCAPYFSTIVLAAHALLLSGDATAQACWLPRLARGHSIATVAYTDNGSTWDDDVIQTVARRCGDTWELSGSKSYVVDGHIADLLLVAAQTPAGLSMFSVEGSAEGLDRTPLITMDQTRKLANLTFDATPAVLIGADGGAADSFATVAAIARTALALEQVGGAAKCLDTAVAYAKTRVQFGRPIGSFQSIKHKCADMLLELEAAKSAAYYAAWCASELNDELPAAASLAKAYCSDAYLHIAAENVQIHGGIGFTWEHSAHIYFKRAKSSQVLLGDPVYHREKVAQLVLDTAPRSDRPVSA
jgi:alkylation response protein AidB-like acyl-CoA dehydrogenase